MSGALKIKPLIAVMIAGILFTSLNSMPLVNAQPTPTSLTIAVTSPLMIGLNLRISECTIEATLKDENDNPLQNTDIDFLIACEDHTHLLGTAKTDSNGVASLKYPYVHTEKVSANFSGTTHYASSSSVYVDIIVIDYTPYLVGLVGGISVVTLIGVVVYLVFLARKNNNYANDGERSLASF